MNRTISRLGATAAASLAVFAFATPAAHAGKPTFNDNTDCGNYCPNPGFPSGNGQGKAPHLAGSQGNADDKNPPGQAPDESDGNQGYECDGNQGIALGNPAHSACEPYTPPPPPPS
ncbi:hypothetical protein G7072_14930 [Nocardioides sp. HDW12B]|uniref:hypothetical protein n=1 Tax=Nocardioides sp. HDW12B TaxID=2714939 RepID=UPI00140D9CC6|nr:hypothetical protein [Nocardioides sp. HDW12B]QIK67465.1 hypothetical protein G7072_14930 [Nocardioides sp. HDW12B]